MIGTIIIVSGITIFGLAGIRIVRPVEQGLIETLGKYSKTAEQGFSWIIPFVQRMIKVNTTEIRIDVEPQSIITQDKLNATVDAVVYYKIKDVQKAIYNVNSFARSVPSLARTTLRAVIGKMTLAKVNENRNEINSKVEKELDKQTNAWGIDIIRVELQKVDPPKDVQDAMNNVVKAENDKIAATDLATAKETEADGYRRAEIQKAEGEKRALILKAEGESQAFNLINKAFVGNAQLLKQLEVTQASLENNTKILLTEKGINPQIIMGEIPITSTKKYVGGKRE